MAERWALVPEDRGSNPRGSVGSLTIDTHVAQPVERAAVNRVYGGSNPSVGAFAPVVQSARISDFQSENEGSNPSGSVDRDRNFSV